MRSRTARTSARWCCASWSTHRPGCRWSSAGATGRRLPIARLAAQAGVAELATEDLRFTRRETADLFAHSYGTPIDDDLVTRHRRAARRLGREPAAGLRVVAVAAPRRGPDVRPGPLGPLGPALRLPGRGGAQPTDASHAPRADARLAAGAHQPAPGRSRDRGPTPGVGPPDHRVPVSRRGHGHGQPRRDWQWAMAVPSPDPGVPAGPPAGGTQRTSSASRCTCGSPSPPSRATGWQPPTTTSRQVAQRTACASCELPPCKPSAPPAGGSN